MRLRASEETVTPRDQSMHGVWRRGNGAEPLVLQKKRWGSALLEIRLNPRRFGLAPFLLRGNVRRVTPALNLALNPAHRKLRSGLANRLAACDRPHQGSLGAEGESTLSDRALSICAGPGIR